MDPRSHTEVDPQTAILSDIYWLLLLLLLIIIIIIIIIVYYMQRSAYFDIKVHHPNADFYKDLTSNHVYRQQEHVLKSKSESMRQGS